VRAQGRNNSGFQPLVDIKLADQDSPVASVLPAVQLRLPHDRILRTHGFLLGPGCPPLQIVVGSHAGSIGKPTL
jgi:hypothetical protein